MPSSVLLYLDCHLLIGLTKSAALELAAHGIRVNAVAPGFTDTQLLSNLAGQGAHLPAMAASVPFRRLCKPSEIGELTVFLLSDRASYISGSVHQSDGAHLAGVGV
jgi:NAD(P)-dependent dehydrogenase (short-subunit alcohol dehydrogenase family)